MNRLSRCSVARERGGEVRGSETILSDKIAGSIDSIPGTCSADLTRRHFEGQTVSREQSDWPSLSLRAGSIHEAAHQKACRSIGERLRDSDNATQCYKTDDHSAPFLLREQNDSMLLRVRSTSKRAILDLLDCSDSNSAKRLIPGSEIYVPI